MESKKLQIITLVLALLSFVGVIAMSGVIYMKLLRNDGEGKVNEIASEPINRKGFIGLPESESINTRGGKKIFSLRGQISTGNDNPYQLSSTEGGDLVTVAIDETTKIYKVVPSGEEGKAPDVIEVPFEAFSIGSLDEIYLVSYETPGDSIAFDKSVASSLSIHINP
ncbi:MAG: hypothetical protein UX58_C0004G0019 [Candidatus Wolfebacteria bacterium GW2011_GWB2_46_69]|nr:MAG: hypothetical protein UX58_C0004G0019 [Candidatus Wolfebacteria bacterium GW2011_GWB2_46_69]KKU54504.1 MAG: hypothetical protein UX76_C0002G0097 [Candidatus Wolfebacteria bacterium GW2011_GWC1_47_103]KKU59831.1 MAG: hypothetical protein UX83_C0002G0118 [Candidatus Wolfebacteria bacterium GW2011_GWE2_47_12]KKU65824.1 MAG: hypothetical protein UX90_C0002G0200 [Candidatus Wolfebacteria bacterium GW2011_GWD2_47_17]KKU73240.1 MAG: hypothetical protein UX96_C0007G0037 [Candidatus Wolfebacteria